MNETTDATAIFAPLWKRKWLILIVGILVAGATYAYYKHQPKVYAATTDLYLGGGSEVQSLLNNTQPNTAQNDRALADQAALINSNVVGNAVQQQLTRERDLVASTGTAQATSATGSDFITISTKAGSGQGAAQLANTYAEVYLRQRDADYRHQIQLALRSTRQQLSGTAKKGTTASSQTLQTQTLVERINQLQSELSIGKTGDKQINPAIASATPLSPNPTRNAIFGFVLGLVLAGIAAYALSRFDRRLRSLADIEAAFQTQILTALPSIRRPIVRRDGEPAPAQPLREALRRLHTILQLGDVLEHDPEASSRTILFVSAEAGDGKSTVLAGLALVQRDAGERVAVIEADLRRPVQGKLLDVDGSRGLAEVLSGRLAVGEAMQLVDPTATKADVKSEESDAVLATAVQSRGGGSVSVLASGGAVANPPALLAERTMPGLLRSVAADFDYVLIDAPPPLEVSDVMPLLPIVDAIVIVARVGHTGETSAQRLVDLLRRASGTPILGIVANDVSSGDIEAYGFSSASYDRHGRRG